MFGNLQGWKSNFELFAFTTEDDSESEILVVFSLRVTAATLRHRQLLLLRITSSFEVVDIGAVSAGRLEEKKGDFALDIGAAFAARR